MFGRRLPLEAHSAKWVEGALAALTVEFGRSPFLMDPKEPSAEFFPTHLDGSDEAVRLTVSRVASFMGIKRGRYRVVIEQLSNDLYLEDHQGHWSPAGAAGLFEDHGYTTVIRLDRQYRTNLFEIIGTAAHELSHHLLLAEQRIDPERFDNELLADLTAVFFGFGLFLANSPRAFEAQMSFWPGTKVRRPEYMSLPMFGHVLAHQAWHRGERKPTWLRHLRPDARVCVKASLKWLHRTGESAYSPEMFSDSA